jgi:hypothetical protein
LFKAEAERRVKALLDNPHFKNRDYRVIQPGQQLLVRTNTPVVPQDEMLAACAMWKRVGVSCRAVTSGQALVDVEFGAEAKLEGDAAVEANRFGVDTVSVAEFRRLNRPARVAMLAYAFGVALGVQDVPESCLPDGLVGKPCGEAVMNNPGGQLAALTEADLKAWDARAPVPPLAPR